MPEYVPPVGGEPGVWIHWPAQHADDVQAASALLRAEHSDGPGAGGSMGE